jgi:catechol 2,3-dioxygenase-like lactoylglutathione lyase family enzyme
MDSLAPRPNTLIFVDLAADDPAAAGRFYAEVFGWEDDARPAGLYHRMVPGGFFPNSDGEDSEIGNLHLGIFKADNARPHPEPGGVKPRGLATEGRKARIWILVGEGQSEGLILETAAGLGAEILWRDHYWSEFNGYNSAFRDPWGNEIVLWAKGGPAADVPDSYTRE